MKMKKIISLILALLLASALLVSCGSGAPSGMKSATIEGEPFILYVPEGFTDNTASGSSSAYYKSIENDLIVVARYFTPENSEMTLDAYMNFCADELAASLEGFEKTAEIAGDVLYGLDARRLEYKMTEGDKAYAVIQRTVKHRGDFVSLVLYATGDGMNVYSDFIDLIVENFTLSEKQAAANTPKVDKKTPEGMQIASSDIVEYRLYAPLSWVCDADSGISEAYYPESEKTNVTVTSYSPSAEERGMSLTDYVEKSLVEYKTSIKNFPNEIVVSDLEVAGKEAKSIEFGAVYGNSAYKLRQVMFYASEFDLYYTFTYTATAEKYAQHMADFEAMVAAFTFR